MQTPADVLRFWFEEVQPAQWWKTDPVFDRLITERFGAVPAQAAGQGLAAWRGSVQGRLAEIVVLDQFSRNIHRATPGAFACDAQALALAKEALALGLAPQLEPRQRAFLYMPFMHSADLAAHAQALVLFAEPGLATNLAAELRNKAILDRFGRYPHRNTILGRASTPEELAFLQLPGSSF